MQVEELVTWLRDALGGMVSKPKSLKAALTYHLDGATDRVREAELLLLAQLKVAGAAHPLIQLFSKQLALWDYLPDPAWGDDTQPNTIQRRARILALLAMEPAIGQELDKRCPANLLHEAAVVIAKQHAPWYDNERQQRSQFYRDAYANYLRHRKGWTETQIQDLEESTRLVTERLSDPERPEAFQAKGLVVGYVQSGKTANFTGVIARAADAGYRLIIVLAGTLNILRSQTQRRIDKELIGRPFLSEAVEPDYTDDLVNFVDHGANPADQGAFNWHRLTTLGGDYKSLFQGVSSFEFKRIDKTKPFYHPDNLHRETARLLVIKKHPDVIAKVAKDLETNRSRLLEIPALVIDDESDQASVNTRKPSASAQQARTATNLAIVNLLEQLPRAQYVGYTATPFANVFIDPNLTEDLFPRDFIISLPRPDSYMGVADFHDLDWPDEDRPGPNERAFVRKLTGEDTAPDNLQRALDSYLLAGAIKLYRAHHQQGLPGAYRHHTMLVHIATTVKSHAAQAKQIAELLDSSGFLTGGGMLRLEALWERDFSEVCAARAGGFPVPARFSEISPFIGECWSRLHENEKPVLIVNGDAKDNPDFESGSIWKILVGGTKLSRGYTIEGLTISYYRRNTLAADTLMQMGRWFGFRRGYVDLVRLFIESVEDRKNEEENVFDESKKTGKKKAAKLVPVDLYNAFEMICRDEIEFRAQLKRYAQPDSGAPILPIQVPPLVPSHLLQPTAKNKMYNARIQFQNFGGDWMESTLAPADLPSISSNCFLAQSLLHEPMNDASITLDRPGATDHKHIQLNLKWVRVDNARVISFLDHYIWSASVNSSAKRQVEFLMSEEDVGIDDWLVICIDGPKDSIPWILGQNTFRPIHRSRIGHSKRFGVYSEPTHRALAEWLSGKSQGTLVLGPEQALMRPRQGVFVFYPTRERISKDDPESPVTPGFALQFPKNNIKKKIHFGVEVKTLPDSVVVTKPD